MKVYMVHSWTVKTGREPGFVAAWQDFAKWMIEQNGSIGSVQLFRDESNDGHFMSVDSWEDEDHLKDARDGDEYGVLLAELRIFLENYSDWVLTLETEEKRPL